MVKKYYFALTFPGKSIDCPHEGIAIIPIPMLIVILGTAYAATLGLKLILS